MSSDRVTILRDPVPPIKRVMIQHPDEGYPARYLDVMTMSSSNEHISVQVKDPEHTQGVFGTTVHRDDIPDLIEALTSMHAGLQDRA